MVNTKNEALNIKITALNSDGSGVGRTDKGKVVFVPFTAVGDEIEVKVTKNTKSVIYAKLVKILNPSADRVELDCNAFARCGGCDFRHISYQAEVKAKEGFIRDAFKRIGGMEPEFLPFVASRDINYYRNNVQLPASEGIYGFYATKSKTIIPHESCKLYPPQFKEIADNIIRNNPNPGKIRIRKGHYSGETGVGVAIYDTMCEVKVKISPNSFYQINTPAAEKLYGIIKEFAEPEGKTILDLYCGIGIIGLSMASQAKEIIGIEITKDAVVNARENAKLNNISNAQFFCGDVSDVLKQLSIVNTQLSIIIDPARRGCDISVLESIAALSPERIVMVSCDPATAARDCKRLYGFGYETVKVRGVDLFPRTKHVECAALLLKCRQQPLL